MTSARLPRSFYARPSTEVAPDLLGQVLVRAFPDGTRAAVRIVEVEAYEPDDPASHAFRGETPRNADDVRTGRPPLRVLHIRHALLHERRGPRSRRGSAVLLRAGEPLEGLDGIRPAEVVTPSGTSAPVRDASPRRSAWTGPTTGSTS